MEDIASLKKKVEYWKKLSDTYKEKVDVLEKEKSALTEKLKTVKNEKEKKSEAKEEVGRAKFASAGRKMVQTTKLQKQCADLEKALKEKTKECEKLHKDAKLSDRRRSTLGEKLQKDAKLSDPRGSTLGKTKPKAKVENESESKLLQSRIAELEKEVLDEREICEQLKVEIAREKEITQELQTKYDELQESYANKQQEEEKNKELENKQQEEEKSKELEILFDKKNNEISILNSKIEELNSENNELKKMHADEVTRTETNENKEIECKIAQLIASHEEEKAKLVSLHEEKVELCKQNKTRMKALKTVHDDELREVIKNSSLHEEGESLKEMSQKVDLLTDELTKCESELRTRDSFLVSCRQEVERLQRKIKTMKESIKKRIVNHTDGQGLNALVDLLEEFSASPLDDRCSDICQVGESALSPPTVRRKSHKQHAKRSHRSVFDASQQFHVGSDTSRRAFNTRSDLSPSVFNSRSHSSQNEFKARTDLNRSAFNTRSDLSRSAFNTRSDPRLSQSINSARLHQSSASTEDVLNSSFNDSGYVDIARETRDVVRESSGQRWNDDLDDWLNNSSNQETSIVYRPTESQIHSIIQNVNEQFAKAQNKWQS